MVKLFYRFCRIKNLQKLFESDQIQNRQNDSDPIGSRTGKITADPSGSRTGKYKADPTGLRPVKNDKYSTGSRSGNIDLDPNGPMIRSIIKVFV